MASKLGILFLGGAKRVSMARKFKTAGQRRDISVSIYSYEMSGTVPIAAEAEVIIGLRWSDPGIYAHLQQICREKDISVVVPFVDGAIAIAAGLAKRTPGIFAPACDADTAEAMFDKRSAATIFESLGLPIPETFDSPVYTDGLRLIAKPRHGSASKGIVKIDSADDFAAIAANRHDYLIQRRIDNRDELTVDCYVRIADGTPVCIVPRVRDSIAGGEVTQTTVIHDADVTDLCRRTLHSTGLRGAVTIQLIRELPSRQLSIMEINPRLGGGAVAAVCAGADLPGYIIDEAGGISPEPLTDYQDIIVARYLDEIAFKL